MNTINTDDDGLEILDLDEMTTEQKSKNVKIQNILKHFDRKDSDGKLNIKVKKDRFEQYKNEFTREQALSKSRQDINSSGYSLS